ncbi:hypothetical protein RB653_000757 [Dictyostelium firmibasis]|uniref:tRNA-splicing endonuclease subunit Sen54 N-terminal domain-containing protein n=1 Tax=Dictyostelium firmibasis TaxID=79012 RepID=A0AAN7U367_9MYCE
MTRNNNKQNKYEKENKKNIDNNNNKNDEIEEDDSSEFRKYLQKNGLIRKKAEKKIVDNDNNNSTLSNSINNKIKGKNNNNNSNNSNNSNDNIRIDDDDFEDKQPVFEQYKTILESHGKSTSKNSMTYGHWDSNLNKFEVTVRKGKQYDSVGQQIGSKLYLHIEEAIYLQDLGIIELYMNQLPLSVQESFKLFEIPSPSPFPIYKYTAYCYLKKLGYILIRHDQNNKSYTKVTSTTKTTTTTTTTTTTPSKINNNRVLSNFNFKISPTSELIKIIKFKNNNNDNQNNSEINETIESKIKSTSTIIKSRNFIPEVLNVYTDLKGFKAFQIIKSDDYIKPKFESSNNNKFMLSQKHDRDQLIQSVYKSNKTIFDRYNIVDLEEEEEKEEKEEDNHKENTKRIKLDTTNNNNNYRSLMNLPQDIYEGSHLNSINRKLQIFKVVSLLNDKEYQNLNIDTIQFNIDYDVYKPTQSFKRTNPGIPDFFLSISKFGVSIPSMNDIARLNSNSIVLPNNNNSISEIGSEPISVPLQFCVVNLKDISFIEYKENLILSSALN